MKFAAIVPVPMLHMVAQSDYHMVLAPMLRHEDYGRFYLEVGGFKILDNGVAEGNQVSVDNIIGWAQALKVDEVVAPDVMTEFEATRRQLKAFCKIVEGMPFGVMGVVQARDWLELDLMVGAIIEQGCTSIALPKLLTRFLGPHARVRAVERIRQEADIDIHCLGCTEEPQEVLDLALTGQVRGLDSAAPVVLGLQGLDCHIARYDAIASHSSIDGYWLRRPTQLVEVNIATFRDWCATTSSSGEV